MANQFWKDEGQQWHLGQEVITIQLCCHLTYIWLNCNDIFGPQMAALYPRLKNLFPCYSQISPYWHRVIFGLKWRLLTLFMLHNLHQRGYSISLTLMLTIVATDSIHSSCLCGSVSPQFIPRRNCAIIPCLRARQSIWYVGLHLSSKHSINQACEAFYKNQ